MKTTRKTILALAAVCAAAMWAAVPAKALWGGEKQTAAVAAFAKSDGEGQLINRCNYSCCSLF